LETHPGERERLLNEDRNLRDRYFRVHNNEAGEYYGRHQEFYNEWHGGGAGGEGWFYSKIFKKLVIFLFISSLERRLGCEP